MLLQINAQTLSRIFATVVGCADATPPADAWYKRNGDNAEIGCKSSELKWQIKCEDNHWTGQVGNCSVQGNYKQSTQCITNTKQTGVVIDNIILTTLYRAYCYLTFSAEWI